MEELLEQMVDILAMGLGDYPNTTKSTVKYAASSLQNKLMEQQELNGNALQPYKDMLIKKLGYDINGHKIDSSIQTIASNIIYFTDLEMDVKRAVRKHPKILRYDKKKKLEPNVRYLKKLGIEKISKVLTRCPQLLGYETKNMQNTVDYFLSIGYDKKEVAQIVSKCPQLLGLSVEENLKPTFEFLNKNGITETNIWISPSLLTLSLQSRIKPRYQIMKDKGLQDNFCPKALTCKDDTFAKKYAQCTLEYWHKYKAKVFK